MIGILPSRALCAHIHDLFYRSMDIDKTSIDAFVETVIRSNDRLLPLCKELAQLLKHILGEEPIDVTEFHHLSITVEGVGVKDRHVSIKGHRFRLINHLINNCDRTDPIIQNCYIGLCKLHSIVKPLSIDEGRLKTYDMIRNIETPFKVKEDILLNFKDFIRAYEFNVPNDWRWYHHLMPLHDAYILNCLSDKKRPTLRSSFMGSKMFIADSKASVIDSYKLPNLLSIRSLYDIYMKDRITFMTLISGIIPDRVDDDEYLKSIQPAHHPIGRMGIRLQEAQKVRTLWMPLPCFRTLAEPMVQLLELLVKKSQHQTVYFDDEQSSIRVQERLFRTYENRPCRMRDLVYSIDQSSFTDNFPYLLQRIVIEELVSRGYLPSLLLDITDLMVKGAYKPGKRLRFNEDVTISFAKGTPMGADGMFMLATLTHELLIRMIQEQTGQYAPFFVQGDDAVIAGDKNFDLYSSLMSELGCEVNHSKTHRSYNMVEFCSWIITPETRAPMYKVKDRESISLFDVVSPRAFQLFGYDPILRYIERKYGQSTLTDLKIAGYIPVDPLIDLELYQLQRYYTARQGAKHLLEDVYGGASASLILSAIFEIEEQYPPMDGKLPYREFDIERSYDKFNSWMEYIKRLIKTLDTCTTASLDDLTSIAKALHHAVEVVEHNFTAYLRRNPKCRDPDGRTPYTSKKVDEVDRLRKSVKDLLPFINNKPDNSQHCEDYSHDGNDISPGV